MALNKIYSETKSKNRSRAVPSGTVAGVPLLVNARPAVTLTARSDATRTDTLSDGTAITYNIGGVGSPAGEATVAFDGTFEFAVTGATTSTASDVAVYITSGGTLTLTASTNTLYGYTDYPTDYVKKAGRAPVKIGA